MLLAKMVHFASRSALDIENLSEKTLEKLIGGNYIQTFADIYRLTKEQLLSIDKFADTSANNLLKAIENSKTPPLDHFLVSLGIPEVGVKTAKLLAERYPDIEQLLSADTLELMGIPGIGVITSKLINEYLKQPEIIAEIRDLLQFVKPIFSSSVTSTALQGKTFCITGSMTVDRETLKRFLEKYSATVTGSVSKKTTLLLVGDNAGASKMNAALKHSVPVLYINGYDLKQISTQIEKTLGVVLREVPF